MNDAIRFDEMEEKVLIHDNSNKINHKEKHPELRDGEMFLTNGDIDSFRDIGWETKRMGNIAYDIKGKDIEEFNGLFPIFIQKKEYDEHLKKKEVK